MSLDSHFKQGPMFGCSDPECCGVYPPEEVDHCPECMVEWPCDVELLRQRAERAEAEAARNWDLADKLDRALARVRTLCDGPNDCKSCSAYSNIRAAIEGDNQ